VRYPDIPGVKPHLIRWLETEDLETYVGPPAEPPIEMPAPVASQPQPKPESAEPAQKPSRPHKETKKKEKRPPDRDRNHGQGSSPRSSKPRKVGTADSASLRRPSAEAFPSS
jgi:hypothetical protein